MSFGIRWYVFTQSRLPQPNTANLMLEKADWSWTFYNQVKKCAALSAGCPSNDAVTITIGPSFGRFAVTESSVPMDARKPTREVA